MSVDATLVQSAVGRIARDLELRDRFEAAPAATLAELGLDPEQVAVVLGHGPSRLLAYHSMVHTRLFATIRTFFGPASERRGRTKLRADVDAWIAGSGPQTTYLRDIPAEFLAWVRPRWAADPSVPAWLGELADHQVLIRKLRHDPREVGVATNVGLALDRPIVCNPTVRLVRYRFGVHRLPKQLDPDAIPIDEPAIVIAYRGPDQEPTFVDIKPRSAQMLERLLAGQTLQDSLLGACAAVGETLDDSILAIAAATLADLIDRHVLLGG